MDELIELVAGVDGLLQLQASADADYFIAIEDDGWTAAEKAAIGDTFLAAYRWQYIHSGVEDRRFSAILGDMLTASQLSRIGSALAGLGAASAAAA